MTRAGILLLCLFSVIVGYTMRSIQFSLDSHIRDKVMAYGFNETNNVWNRIRVNDQGHVVCVKE